MWSRVSRAVAGSCGCRVNACCARGREGDLEDVKEEELEGQGVDAQVGG